MKGLRQYEAFKAGKPLSFKGAILAQCYVCNGEAEGGEDCLGVSCPLYQYMPFRKGRQKKKGREISPEQKRVFLENVNRGRNRRVLPSGDKESLAKTASETDFIPSEA